MQLLDELSMTGQHRENYFPVPLDTISLKYNWLFDETEDGIEGTQRGHRLHPLRVENGAPFQHAESAHRVSTPESLKAPAYTPL